MANENTYRSLQELSKSDFQIVGGEPNIIGWEVKNESGVFIGEVKELLFDPETQAIRYMVIDLADNGMHLDHKHVMIPIGLAHLNVGGDEVTLPNIHIDQFNALPDYEPEKVGPDTEVYIRSVIGSPAALRIEESISEFDQNEFYTHHHFDKERFYQRDLSNENLAGQESLNTASIADRTEEEETINHLIDHSKQQNFETADPNVNPATNSDDSFSDTNTAKEDELNNPATRGI